MTRTTEAPDACAPPFLRDPSDIGSQIGGPLSVLADVLDLLLETGLNAEQRELAETGKAAVDELADRLDRMLEKTEPSTPKERSAGGNPSKAILPEPTDRKCACPEPLRILLAEDNPLNQKLVVSLLRNRGHHVTVAGNGRKAVTAARGGGFDLILMDIQMPVMDGLEATRRIRAMEEETGAPRTPIVAVTAHVLAEEKERCFSHGMDAFVGKPIRRDDFLSTVEGIRGGVPAENAEASGAVLDPSALMSIAGGNKELVKELVGLYWQSLPKQMAQLREALDAGDASQCRYWAHALKGMSLNLSAHQTADIALEMELAGRDGDLSAVEDMWQRLSASVDRLQQATDRILADINAGGSP